MKTIISWVCLTLCLQLVAAQLPRSLSGPIDESSDKVNLRFDAVYSTLETRRNVTVSALNEMHRCLEPCDIIDQVLALAKLIYHRYMGFIGSQLDGLGPFAFKLHHIAAARIEALLCKRGVDSDVIGSAKASFDCLLSRISNDIANIVADALQEFQGFLTLIVNELKQAHVIGCPDPDQYVDLREAALLEGEKGNSRLLNQVAFAVNRYLTGVTQKMRDIVAAALEDNESQ